MKYEKDYKKEVVSRLKDYRVFCVETEETVKGFPDILLISKDNTVRFVEVKVSNNLGVISFRKEQVKFYKVNSTLPIFIHAYNNKNCEEHFFDAGLLFDSISNYALSGLKVVLP